MHEVLVKRLGGLRLPRKSVVRLTDRPDMTLDVYRGRNATMQVLAFHSTTEYRIYPAIRQGFCPSRMTSNNEISLNKFCYNTNFTLPKQSQRSRSILQDGSTSLGLFLKEKKLCLITEEIR